ncbi:MAG TPA: nuclear transport factor 2 family protein [Ilumatobacteraceae bacterium]|nr:nuclear transport factor 2 family protein [Ilumatobacteraceae bacterium]
MTTHTVPTDPVDPAGTTRTAAVARYVDGFRRGDHAAILACLTADVVWDLPGHAHLEGKAAFDGEIENAEFTGRPELHVDRLLESSDAVVAIGDGAAQLATGGRLHFAFCDVFTFRGELIARVESYVVPLPTAA